MENQLAKQASAQNLSRLQQGGLSEKQAINPASEILLTSGWMFETDTYSCQNQQPIPGLEVGVRVDIRLPSNEDLHTASPSVRSLLEFLLLVAYLDDRKIAHTLPLEGEAIRNLLKAGKKITAEITSVKERGVIPSKADRSDETKRIRVVIINADFYMAV